MGLCVLFLRGKNEREGELTTEASPQLTWIPYAAHAGTATPSVTDPLKPHCQATHLPQPWAVESSSEHMWSGRKDQETTQSSGGPSFY